MIEHIDLDELVQRCRTSSARSFIKEAVDCYRVGAYRACIITTWIALVYDLVDKLRELSLNGDKAAETVVDKFDDTQRKKDIDASLAFEKDILRVVREQFELITTEESRDLARLFEDRNRFGHPNLNRETEAHNPPPELARLHLRNVIESVLERPPVQGKAALEYIRGEMDSEYFPTEIDAAETFLKATPLPRAKKNVVYEIIRGGLISLMREALLEKRMLQRLLAVKVASLLHPAVAVAVLKDKFDGDVFKSSDACLSRVLWVLASHPEAQSALHDATWIKLEGYVQNIPNRDIDALAIALRIPRLLPFAEARAGVATNLELTEVIEKIGSSPSSGSRLTAAFIAKCIASYSEAGSFDSANSLAASLILPIIPQMNAEHARAVIAAGRNKQVAGSFRFIDVGSTIKESGVLTEQALREVIEENGLTSTFADIYAEPLF